MPEEMEVRAVLNALKDAYCERNLAKLDYAMDLFDEDEQIEMIGIGAYQRNGVEWFVGRDRIREIIASDWEYWGNIEMDVPGAQIHVHGEVAWVSMTATLNKSNAFEKALPQYHEQMGTILNKVGLDPKIAMANAAFYGIGRLRDSLKSEGEGWPIVISLVLIKRKQGWKFHTLHWSVPAE
ncbi:MAG: nuclear transport factor 2 family protein [Anaerolineaceae bacterium]